MTSKWEAWSLGTNLRLPFEVNVMLNLSSVSDKQVFICIKKILVTQEQKQEAWGHQVLPEHSSCKGMQLNGLTMILFADPERLFLRFVVIG